MTSILQRSNKKPPAPEQAAWGELYQVLHTLLERRHYLLPFIKEFHSIDNALGRYFEQAPPLHIGRYKVRGYYRDSLKYCLPPGLKARYCKKERRWILDITKREGG